MIYSFLLQISPHISSSDVAPYVHHMVLHLCKNISQISLNTSGDVCDNADEDIQRCCGVQLLAAYMGNWWRGRPRLCRNLLVSEESHQFEWYAGFLLP